ncbi:RNA recognition motif domain containing protein [Babesia ovis]|uniref:RNA recognition motif domain containing protein n=1 Tax=Babesia ovis TaxID=5869 RepID=A0A9W5TCC5_BABOV|nr:RNA recognition motif domain containing protein [Babesia ovis]
MNDRSKNIKLFVGNLPYEVTEAELRGLLHGCGNIRFLIVRKDKQTNKSKGYAHVEYRHEYEAVEAFKRLLGKELRGRVLKVDFCDEALRSRYPDLIGAATSAFHSGIGTTGILNVASFPDATFEVTAHGNQITSSYFCPQQLHCLKPHIDSSNHEEEYPQKRERCDTILVDESGRMCSDGLVNVLTGMNMLDVATTVDLIDQLMAKSLVNTRYILQSHPKMESALIHAKMLLGLTNLESNKSTGMKDGICEMFDDFSVK